MTWIKDNLLTQDCVYWPPPVRDGYGGYTWEFPVEIRGRWEDRAINVFDVTGRELVSKAVVWIDRLLEVGGYLWLGKFIDTANDYKPPLDEDSYKDKSEMAYRIEKGIGQQYNTYAAQIINIQNIVSLRSKNIIYHKAYLQ